MSAPVQRSSDPSYAAYHTDECEATKAREDGMQNWPTACNCKGRQGSSNERAALQAILDYPGLPAVIYGIAQSALRTPDETNEPSMGLLVSMAIRMDHGLGVPGYYDQPMFGNSGPTHQQRLDAAITTARQMWEEATGHGFYRPEKEAEYATRASLKANAVSTLCAVCDQIKELHPNTHPWTPRTSSGKGEQP